MRGYHMIVFFSDKDNCFVADMCELTFCSGIGENPLDAVREVNKAKKAWLKAAEMEGKPIPEPRCSFSKIVMRINELLALGAGLVWVADCGAKMITAHRDKGVVTIMEADQEITGEDVLPDFRCKVSEFFKLPGA
jgi:predicted RNase H-like HicB family nuclease